MEVRWRVRAKRIAAANEKNKNKNKHNTTFNLTTNFLSGLMVYKSYYGITSYIKHMNCIQL